MPLANAADALPVDAVLPALCAALAEQGRAVLVAPPGAGKTTRVPLALLDQPWAATGRIVMLEPRRLATRASARRMASLLGEPVGETVGFRVRGESRVAARTRVEVVTEGVLTRMLVSDPALDGVVALIFDEFHERSLNADVGLALALQSRALLRPELRVLVMSATLDAIPVAALLDDAPVITSEGRAFPVDIRYLPQRGDRFMEEGVASAILRALREEPSGSVLAFLPGASEIQRCASVLEMRGLPERVRIHRLYGDLTAWEQDAALAPPAPGMRHVVLATSIAETSLTIEGVHVVVDGGYARVPRYAPRTGLTRLETVPVSHASAAQRSGRAGRTAPGVAYRLWDEALGATMPRRAVPEILEADLASMMLDLAAAGIVDPSSLRWIDSPPAGAVQDAVELLMQLGALDDRRRITTHGRVMAALGTHPRLAHMMAWATAAHAGATGALVAALLQERDVMRGEDALLDPDLASRVELAARAAQPDDSAGIRTVRLVAARWRAQLGVGASDRVDVSRLGELCAEAYPDRVALRRVDGGHRYLLTNGTGVELAHPGGLADAEWLVVADLEGRAGHTRVRRAARLEPVVARAIAERRAVTEEVVEWDDVAGVVRTEERRRMGAIVLGARPLRDPRPESVAAVVRQAIEDGCIQVPWSEGARALRERMVFAASINQDVHAPTDAEMAALVEPQLWRVRSRADVARIDLVAALNERLSWDQRVLVDALAPTHLTMPTGTRVPVDYSDPAAPAAAVRLQELFGVTETPRVGDGRVPIVLHLLSPARRPVQVTRDLAGFWKHSYFEVRKELRGRYPRHAWPDDPITARPLRRSRTRG